MGDGDTEDAGEAIYLMKVKETEDDKFGGRAGERRGSAQAHSVELLHGLKTRTRHFKYSY